MKLFEIIEAIEKVAPPSLQEDYDNSGLLVGSPQSEVKKALLTLDTTEAVVQEAIAEGCDLIISHHPIVFRGLKRLNGSNYVERVVMTAIKNNIAIYACHTNLDNVLKQGVNSKIAAKLGLSDVQILKPMQQALMKLTVFTPHTHADAVREALFAGGAGHVGNYDECSFNIHGQGTFRGGENTNPVVGKKGERTSLEEQRIEVLLPKNRFSQVMKSLRIAHPYEEIAYYSVDLNNAWQDAGSGLIGILENPVRGDLFPAFIKESLNAEVVRFTAPVAWVKKVAVCGGSGAFLIKNALQSGADAYITGDVKYHEFFDAENRMMICDPGHYETEQFTIELFAEILSEKFPNFATRFSHTYTNPIQYHY
jgi:dinuclear metal center YbgI/SA1388 family protein